MKILIISPGKKHDETTATGIAEYEKRLGKRFTIEWNFSEEILKSVRDDDFVILLDERGKDIDTPGFSKLIDERMQSGLKRLVFVIGGAYGVDDAVKQRANMTYKLSSLVFPHMLVRLILMEQLYRAMTIIDGGKYHHA